MISITLQTEHLDFSEKLAKARTAESEQSNRGGRNGSPIGGRAGLKYDMIGARGECASYLWLSPVRWNVKMPVGKVADLDSFIDVKTRPHHWQDLVIQETDPDDWAYLLVCACEHPTYEIRGWCWGREGKQQRFYFDPPGGWPAFFIKADDPVIRHPDELLAELRRRQTESPELPLPLPPPAPARQPLLHYCHCGQWASFGFGVSLLRDQPGTWYCGVHKPVTPAA